MSRNTCAFAAALALLAGAAQAQGAAAPAAPVVPPLLTTQAVPTHPSVEMQRLMTSAQQLREAIQVLAQKTPGPERNLAIAKAQEALLRTQQAMVDLPADQRGPVLGSTAPRGYDESVRTLMAAADSLRHSIQAMAREPAGERRNQAIRDTNRALLDTQVAMANAYDATSFPQRSTATMGASAMQCVWLGTMWGCT